MLPIFNIGKEFDEQKVPGTLIETASYDKVNNAVVYRFKIDEGQVLLTVIAGILHEVVYQTPKLFPWSRKKKNKFLLSRYCEIAGWREILDNGFGKTYQSNDGEMCALWSYTMDFNTFGTMAFHEDKL